MDKIYKDKFPGFCVLPYIYGYSNNTQGFSLCCEFDNQIKSENFKDIWNGFEYQNYRKSFNNRIIPKECNICVMDEQNGIESLRQSSNRKYKTDAEYFYHNKTHNVTAPKIFDIRFSNYCNLECVMCGTKNSSAIVKRLHSYSQDNDISDLPLTLTNNENIDNKNKNTLEFLFNNINSIIELHFAGGEPFLMPEVKELLQYCVDKNVSEKIELRFTTNVTTVRSSWIDNILLKFKKIKINCSVDGTGEILEYIRYPSRWNVIKKNLLLFKKISTENKHFVFDIEMCLHSLNFKNFDSLLEFCYNNEIGINCSLVYRIGNFDSKILNYDVLDQTFRQNTIEQIEQKKYKFKNTNITQTLFDKLKNTPQRNLTNQEKTQLKEMIKYWDNHRTVKFNDLYPELLILIDKE